MRSDAAVARAVVSELSAATAMIGAARLGAERVTGLVGQMRAKLIEAQGPLADRGLIQNEINQLREQVETIVASSAFRGVNLLGGGQVVPILSAVPRNAAGRDQPQYLDVAGQDLTLDGALAPLRDLDLSAPCDAELRGASEATFTFRDGRPLLLGDAITLEYRLAGVARTVTLRVGQGETGAVRSTDGVGSPTAVEINVDGDEVGVPGVRAAAIVTALRDALLSARRIDFDDVPLAMGDEAALAGGYEGFDWSKTGVYRPDGSTGYAASSGGNIAFFAEARGWGADYPGTPWDDYPGSAGTPMVIRRTDGGRFGALGADLSSAFVDGLAVTVEGVRDGQVVGSKIIQINRGGPTPVLFEEDGESFARLDELRLSASDYFGLDGLRLETGAQAGLGLSAQAASAGDNLQVDSDGGTLRIRADHLPDGDALLAVRGPGDDLARLLGKVDAALLTATKAATYFGSVEARIGLQEAFLGRLADMLDGSVASLVEADMSEEAARHAALLVRRDLVLRMLAIANGRGISAGVSLLA